MGLRPTGEAAANKAAVTVAVAMAFASAAAPRRPAPAGSAGAPDGRAASSSCSKGAVGDPLDLGYNKEKAGASAVWHNTPPAKVAAGRSQQAAVLLRLDEAMANVRRTIAVLTHTL